MVWRGGKEVPLKLAVGEQEEETQQAAADAQQPARRRPSRPGSTVEVGADHASEGHATSC